MKKGSVKFGKLLFVVAASFWLLLCGAQPIIAANTSGSCGENATWTLQNGVLTIAGSGDMEDYTESSLAPWHNSAENIKKIVVSEGITQIGDLAFYKCSFAESASIAGSVITVGDYAFFECKNIVSISLGNGIVNIGESCFERCSSLSTIKLPESLSSIGERAFYRCSSLSSITVPKYAAIMGPSVFAYCENLVQAVVKSYLTELPPWTFYGCSSLVSISLPSSVSEIGEYAFYNCESLETVYTDSTKEKADQLESLIKENVTEFTGVQNNTNLDNGHLETWRPSIDDSTNNTTHQVIQKDAAETESAVVSGTIVEKPSSNEESDIDYKVSIDAVIKDDSGWFPVLDMIDKYVQQQPSLEKETSNSVKIDVTVNLQDSSVIPGNVLEAVAGKNVQLYVNSNDAVIYSLDCSSIPTNTKLTDYSISFEVIKNTSPTEEHKKVIGDAVSYLLKFHNDSEFAMSIIIPVDYKYAKMYATLCEKPVMEKWVRSQSALIDDKGMVEFYLSEFNTVTEYLIGIDVHNVDSMDVLIPEGLYDEYGGLTDAEGNKYVITGRNTLFNMTIMQFSLVVFGVIIVSGLLVWVIMIIYNKRKHTLDVIRREALGEEIIESKD